MQNVERAILDGTEQGVVSVLTLTGVTTMMFAQEPRLAALVFLPLPILVIMAIRYAKVSRKNWKAVRETSGELNSLLVEDIQGNRLIHSFALRIVKRIASKPSGRNWKHATFEQCIDGLYRGLAQASLLLLAFSRW